MRTVGLIWLNIPEPKCLWLSLWYTYYQQKCLSTWTCTSWLFTHCKGVFTSGLFIISYVIDSMESISQCDSAVTFKFTPVNTPKLGLFRLVGTTLFALWWNQIIMEMDLPLNQYSVQLLSCFWIYVTFTEAPSSHLGGGGNLLTPVHFIQINSWFWWLSLE